MEMSKKFTRQWSIESDYDVSDLSMESLDLLDNTPSTKMTLMQEELWISANAGDLLDVHHLLNEGVDVNFTHTDYGSSPLHVAVENGHTDVVKELLNQEFCNPGIINQIGHTPYMEAAMFDDVDMMHVLEKGGIHMDAIDHAGKSALLLALQTSCRHSAMHLIKNGCDLDIVDDLGQSALYLLLNTMDRDALKIVKKLLKSGYDISKDKEWLEGEGMSVQMVHRAGFTTKLVNKLRSTLHVSVSHHELKHKQIFAESSYGSKRIRILKTCD